MHIDEKKAMEAANVKIVHDEDGEEIGLMVQGRFLSAESIRQMALMNEQNNKYAMMRIESSKMTRIAHKKFAKEHGFKMCAYCGCKYNTKHELATTVITGAPVINGKTKNGKHRHPSCTYDQTGMADKILGVKKITRKKFLEEQQLHEHRAKKIMENMQADLQVAKEIDRVRRVQAIKEKNKFMENVIEGELDIPKLENLK